MWCQTYSDYDILSVKNNNILIFNKFFLFEDVQYHTSTKGGIVPYEMGFQTDNISVDASSPNPPDWIISKQDGELLLLSCRCPSKFTYCHNVFSNESANTDNNYRGSSEDVELEVTPSVSGYKVCERIQNEIIEFGRKNLNYIQKPELTDS